MILPKYVHFNGHKFCGNLKEFSITSRFLGSKMQKSTFYEENKCFNCSFYQIEVQVITNSSNRLWEKQILECLLMTDF